jgi:hypothetical protein
VSVREVIWTLEKGGVRNVNLARFPVGGGVGEQINEEVDVFIVR